MRSWATAHPFDCGPAQLAAAQRFIARRWIIVHVATGSAASAEMGDTEIGLSQVLSASARGPMPGIDNSNGFN